MSHAPSPAAQASAELSQLNMTDIQAFVTLLDTLNVSRAAIRLGMGQPQLSTRLARLRRLTGDLLFVRGPGGVVPTATAQSLEAPARELLAQAEHFLAPPAEFDPRRAHGTLHLAAPDYLDPMLLPRLAGRLRAAAPSLALSVHPLTDDLDYAQKLADGRLDLVIANWPDPPSQLHRLPLMNDELVVMMGSHHPLAQRSLTMQAYLQARHAAPTAMRPGLRSTVDTMLARLGHTRQIALECPVFSLIPYVLTQTDLLLTTGKRFTDFFESSLPVRVTPLPLPLPPLQYYLLWHPRTRRDGPIKWLREQIAACVRPSSPYRCSSSTG
ncbi:hypothetical protein CDO44_25860 [Pigmentiphaga sp. NML080357]|uniref:LysR family transcriptional regulator n=1 Tax=Pigmentiphaga sp. NML080357 TaxID=2008675 RepID=UPI000B40C1A0|nr:LysR family transcriptional regulator [Pigmentiphaga sp. NML080357]OVZ54741.1 hypothetical protein CDO44_25860 [Pigmentiphaga sp. NML080357]